MHAAPGIIIGLGLFEANTIQFGLDQLPEAPTQKLSPSSTGTTGVSTLSQPLIGLHSNAHQTWSRNALLMIFVTWEAIR